MNIVKYSEVAHLFAFSEEKAAIHDPKTRYWVSPDLLSKAAGSISIGPVGWLRVVSDEVYEQLTFVGDDLVI